MGKFYEGHPILSRLVVTGSGIAEGVCTTLFLPIISALGLLIMPAMAAGHALKGNYKEAGSWLVGTSFCVLGIGATIAFMAVTAYYTPIIWGSVLFISIVTINVSYHVYKASQEPINNQIDQDSVNSEL